MLYRHVITPVIGFRLTRAQSPLPGEHSGQSSLDKRTLTLAHSTTLTFASIPLSARQKQALDSLLAMPLNIMSSFHSIQILTEIKKEVHVSVILCTCTKACQISTCIFEKGESLYHPAILRDLLLIKIANLSSTYMPNFDDDQSRILHHKLHVLTLFEW